MITIKTKTVQQSKVSVGYLMQREHANLAGNVHGGEIMKIMDNTAGIVAYKHSHAPKAVTARVDQMEFHKPMYIGNLVTCEGKLIYVGNSSMEIQVTVWVEDIMKDDLPVKALTAFFTMVALDQARKPLQVPRLKIESDEEKKLFNEGEKRYRAYKEKK